MVIIEYWNEIEQGLIMLLSAMSIWFVSGSRRKLGFIIGLSVQPLWFMSSYRNGLFGVFVLSCWYTMSYIRGLVREYRLDNRDREKPLDEGLVDENGEGC